MKALVLGAEPEATNPRLRASHEWTRVLLRMAFFDLATRAREYGQGDPPFRNASNDSATEVLRRAL